MRRPKKAAAPTEFPRLRGRKRIALDLETHDPELKQKGPGVRRGAYIVGVAVAPDKGQGQYLPIAHREGHNHDPAKVLGWLKDELKDYDGAITGANLNYDFDFLAQVGVHAPKASIEDVQLAEPLLDENAFSYSLDRLGQDYLGRGKNEAALVEKYGKRWKEKMRELPSHEVAPYAVEDVELPLEIIEKQLKRIEEEDLGRVWDVERRLPPMLLHMRRKGVLVDVPKAERLSLELKVKLNTLQHKLNKMAGRKEVSADSAADLAQIYDKKKILYPRTKRGAPSFTKDWLKVQEDPISALVSQIRRLRVMKNTFVDGYVLGDSLKGSDGWRIHTEFNQLRSDDGGTVSGRFSSSHPNLQNIPSRDEELAPLVRGLFLPELGKQWFCRDWSQIEFRLLVHYAALVGAPGGEEAAEMFIKDHKTDYHEFVIGLTGLGRKPAKNFNFGKVYGMGLGKMARMMGLTIEECKPLDEIYDAKVPFAKKMYKDTSNRAKQRGYIRTILGRKRRFNMWEPSDWEASKKVTATTWERALAYTKDETEPHWHGQRLRRAYTYKALNALLQGSAADLMKLAMVEIWESGLCEHLDVQLTVHDELDGSVGKSKREQEALREMHYIMENCLKLEIPILSSGKEGSNWAEAM